MKILRIVASEIENNEIEIYAYFAENSCKTVAKWPRFSSPAFGVWDRLLLLLLEDTRAKNDVFISVCLMNFHVEGAIKIQGFSKKRCRKEFLIVQTHAKSQRRGTLTDYLRFVTSEFLKYIFECENNFLG